MTTTQKFIPSLNGLRAVSILIVLLSHWDRTAGMPAGLAGALSSVFYGTIGVRMFFVISGFIITLLLLRELESNGTINFRAFYYRRILRIFPPFYAYLIVICILKMSGLVYIDTANIVVAFLYLENFRLAPETNWLVIHSWSLSVEEQFYFLWPALLFKLRNINFRAKHIALVMAAGAFMRAVYYKYTIPSKYLLAPFFMHADCLFIGCYIGHLYFKRSSLLIGITDRLNTFWLFLGVVLVWAAATMEYHPKYDVIFIPVSAMVTSCISALFLLFFVLKPDSLGGKILNSRPFDFLGRLSYSLYIWQQFFLNPNKHLVDAKAILADQVSSEYRTCSHYLLDFVLSH